MLTFSIEFINRLQISKNKNNDWVKCQTKELLHNMTICNDSVQKLKTQSTENSGRDQWKNTVYSRPN